MMYQSVDAGEALSQGDIIDGCPIFGAVEVATALAPQAQPTRWFVRIIVLTQACDLAQTKTSKVLVAVVHDAAELVQKGILKASVVRDQVRRSLVYGWYFLPAAPVPINVSESIVDLRDVHTVSRRVLEHLIDQGKRVARFSTPYREHLAQHFTVTYARIGLPQPFESEP
ncbi:MAG: hypothetical protein GXY83_28190 [Rhodopirellula sp.]|nr:hypothetical protein [Rhodopirellula sp.]